MNASGAGNASDGGRIGPTLAPAAKVVRKSIRDLEFICGQILRFARMPPKQLLKHMAKRREDAFHMIPHPDGRGHLSCGIEAERRFGILADRVLEYEPQLSGRLSRSKTKDRVVAAFVQRVLREKKEVDAGTAEQILRDVSEGCKASLRTAEHFVPCVLFLYGGPDEFSIGPVTFSRRVAFFRSRRASLKKSVHASIQSNIEQVERAVEGGFPRDRATTSEQSRHFIRGLQARALKTFRQYPWIARVQVSECDHETGEDVAERAVGLAINSMRILLGARHTDRIRLAWSRSDALQTARMWAGPDGIFHVGVGSRADGQVGVENWYEGLTLSGGFELKAFGSAFTPLVTCTPIRHVHQRILDAVNWFGDAATDPEPTASIVKYVSAIERAVFGSWQQGRTKDFASRLEALWKAYDCDGQETVGAEAREIYEARSRLLHGAVSPRDAGVDRLAVLSEKISRLTILCVLQLYPMMIKAYGDPDPEQLEEVMTRMRREGLGWLAKKANYSIGKRA